jgi:hypothetical protein
LHFADRVQKHLFNGGALTLAENQDRWMARADQIEAAIIGESARWGDAREGEVVNVPPTTTVPVMTVDHWRDSIAQVMGYFSQSHDLAISRFTTAGLFPGLGAPLLNQFGGVVSPGFDLTLSKPAGSPGSAVIYYTLDGSDPRLLGGGLSASATAYSGPISLESSTQIKTRIRNGSTWSPIIDAPFAVTPPRLPGDYDSDGTVEIEDYAIWKAAYGDLVTPNTSGDGNGDGRVNAADYTVWRNNLGLTNQTEPDYSFNIIGQTYDQDFNSFRGTEETLPNHFTVTVVSGIDIYRDTFNSTTDSASSFTGIKAATSDDNDYSFAWRESTGAAALEDTRVLFQFTNNTDQAITGFDVSYDVEAWVNGRRDNQVRFKYDVYADSVESQAAEGRNAFETDVFATVNPNHTPIASNGDQFVLNGKAVANRVNVSGYVDLTTLLKDETNPGIGVFGAIMPGQTAYFRWQISNAALSDGNRSALGIDNISITALATLPGGGGLASSTELATELVTGSALAASLDEPWSGSLAAPPSPLDSTAVDLALADSAWASPTDRSRFGVVRAHDVANADGTRALDRLLLLSRSRCERPVRERPLEFEIDASRGGAEESVRDRHFAAWGTEWSDLPIGLAGTWLPW